MPYKDHAKKKENSEKYHEDLRKHAKDSIVAGRILDQKKWDLWCNVIKRCANNKKHPYSDEFTNASIFDMMILGCFYCGDVATTVDRKDSTLEHTPDNCVGCCYGCNNAKGASDPATFIRKAYYNARKTYVDETIDIWFINKQKPSMSGYKYNAEKRGIRFELTKGEWDTLITSVCEYCSRRPTTWFGVDRVVPSRGYVIGNVVPCCFDCNLDKHKVNAVDTLRRNEKIANRVDTGELVIKKCPQVNLHRGTQKSSKRVCAYGNMYASKIEASRALGRSDCYVKDCIREKRYPDDIFEVEK